jgi:hypothetical protein
MGNLPTFIVFEDGDKINFIDVNNVLVGYDLSCSCCENANWFISDKVIEKWPEKEEQDKNLDGFLFDKEFFMEISSIPSEDGYDHLGDGGMVVFKLINTCGDIVKEKYLHLYNCQNGYYSHGFKMNVGDENIRCGSI